jgi:uncharacterized membrane protein
MSSGDFEHMQSDRVRAPMRWVLAGFFVLAGVAHLRVPDVLLAITPDWVPFPREVILATGVFELVAASVLVFSARWRAWAGVALATYAICVWPANFKHAFEGIDIGYVPSSWWYHGPRLALQPVIAWWALFSSGAIDWPWRDR